LSNIEPRDLCEQYILSGMIINPDEAIPAVSHVIDGTHFFDPLNRLLFEQLSFLYQNNHPVAVESMVVYLKNQAVVKLKMTQADVYLYLTRIIHERGGFASHCVFYAKRLVEYKQREVLMAAGESLQDENKSASELIEETSTVLSEVSRQTGLHRPKTGGDAVQEFYESMSEQCPEDAVDTGFDGINSRVQLRPGRVIIVAARPRVGKSTLLLNIASNAAIDYGHSTMFVSLEMSLNDLTKRIVASRTSVPFHLIERDKRALHKDWWDEMVKCGDEMSQSRMYLCDQTAMSIAQIGMIAKERAASEGLDALFVDYLTLVEPESTRPNREAQVAGISRGLKRMARELNIPVVVAAQLNRDFDKREAKSKKTEDGLPPMPKLSDLRESGSIEQDADVVLFINRNADESRGPAKIRIAKNRHGTGGDILMRWDGGHQRFEEEAAEVTGDKF